MICLSSAGSLTWFENESLEIISKDMSRFHLLGVQANSSLLYLCSLWIGWRVKTSILPLSLHPISAQKPPHEKSEISWWDIKAPPAYCAQYYESAQLWRRSSPKREASTSQFGESQYGYAHKLLDVVLMSNQRFHLCSCPHRHWKPLFWHLTDLQFEHLGSWYRPHRELLSLPFTVCAES